MIKVIPFHQRGLQEILDGKVPKALSYNHFWRNYRFGILFMVLKTGNKHVSNTQQTIGKFQ